MNITDKAIQAYIKAAQKVTTTKYIYHSIGNNLWFRIHTKTGNAAWLYRIAMPDESIKSGYKFTNKTIGQYPGVTLLQARLKAAEMGVLVKAGDNPVTVAQAEIKKLVTLQQIWDKWLSVAEIKKNTNNNVVSLYNNHLSKIADRPLQHITDKIAYDTIIAPLLDAGKSAQALKVLAKLKQLVRFGRESQMININPFIELNIAKEYKVKAKKVLERTLNKEELKIFLFTLEQAYTDGIIDIRYHHLFKLYLMTGARRNELSTLKWEHYNQADKTIFLTGTKTDHDLTIKLPEQAIKLIEELKQIRINDYVFYGIKENQPISVGTIRDYLIILTEQSKMDSFTIRDMRRTFSSRLSGMGFRLELIEKATNHLMQGTKKHYQHDDMLEERYDMLQKWANYLVGLVAK